MAGRTSIPAMSWHVYLSGEIHSNWRARIANADLIEEDLDVELSAPVTDHASSDDVRRRDPRRAADATSGRTTSAPAINAIRTRTLIEQSDVVVVRFGDEYKQWNAAFDAGYAAALGKPLITLHPGAARPRAEGDRPRRARGRPRPDAVVDILRYVWSLLGYINNSLKVRKVMSRVTDLNFLFAVFFF